MSLHCHVKMTTTAVTTEKRFLSAAAAIVLFPSMPPWEVVTDKTPNNVNICNVTMRQLMKCIKEIEIFKKKNLNLETMWFISGYSI